MSDVYDTMTDDETEHESPYDTNHFDPKFRTTVHIHIESSASDCDGPLYRSSVWVPDADDSSAEFFVRWMLSLCAYNPDVEISLREDGEWRGSYSQRTDEGYHAEEHHSCIYEECRGQQASQRDVYAERMGY